MSASQPPSPSKMLQIKRIDPLSTSVAITFSYGLLLPVVFIALEVIQAVFGSSRSLVNRLIGVLQYSLISLVVLFVIAMLGCVMYNNILPFVNDYTPAFITVETS